MAVTPSEVELAAAPTMYVDSYTMTPKKIVLGVRKSGGEVLRVSCEHGDGILVHDEQAEVLGNVEGLVAGLFSSEAAHRKMGRLFHEHETKDDVTGFSSALPDLDQVPGMPPFFLRWDETGELHQISGVGITGDFKGYQCKIDFKGLLLGDQLFGVAQGATLGREAVWVGRQVADNEARISWQFLDAPPGA